MLSGVNSHIYIPSVQREKGRKKLQLNQEELHWMNACEVLNIELGTSYSNQLGAGEQGARVKSAPEVIFTGFGNG